MALFALVFVVGLLVAAAMWRGLILSTLWGWVAVPYFSAEPIGIPLAIAVSACVGMLTSGRIGNEMVDEKKKFEPWAQAFLNPLIVLCIVWIALKFV